MSLMRIKMRVFRLLFCVMLLAVTLYTSLSATVLTKQQRETAYRKNPSDNMAKYKWAVAAPCSTSIRLYKEIVLAANAHDTLKASASIALGEYWFARKNYKSAAEQYKTAIKYVDKAFVRDRWALSLYCDGQYEAALTLWNALALELKKKYGVIADFYSGCAGLHKGDYTKAMKSFEKCGKPDPRKPFTVEALSGKHFCLIKMGRQKDADILSGQLRKFSLPFIDWATFNSKLLVANAKTAEEKKSQEIDKDLFTVQVGAFSKLENASALQSKMSQLFKNVAIATVTLDEKVFYRVRVGSFPTREEAELFVVDSVQKAGFTGKAVPKKMPDQN